MDRDAFASFERGINAVPSDIAMATARWATADEVTAHADAHPTGLLLGQLKFDSVDDTFQIRVDDNRHIILLAGTRAGKGVSIIIPYLLFEEERSVFVLDPKGENATLTCHRRGQGTDEIEGMGQDVYVLDPFRVSDVPENYRASFNPMDWLPDDDTINYEAEALANAIIMTSEHSDPHWSDSARSFIATLILHVSTHDSYKHSSHTTNDGRLPRNLLTVRKLIMEGSASYVERKRIERDLQVKACEDFLEHIKQEAEVGSEAVTQAEADLEDALALSIPYGFDALILEMMENDALDGIIRRRTIAFAEIPQKERGSILSTARLQTLFLEGRSIEQSLSHSSFDMRDLRNNPTSVYLCLPTRFFDTHSRWLRLILGQTLNLFESMGPCEPDDPQTLFVLDEMAVLGHMKSLERAAGLMAGYAVQLLLILQDLGQLKRHFKVGWETFVGNAGTVAAFGVSDLTTCEYLSKSLGKVEIERRIKTETSSISSGSSTQRGAPAGAQFGGSRIKAELGRINRMDTGSAENLNETSGYSVNSNLSIGNLMNADEIKHFFAREEDNILVMMNGKRPMALERIKYFESAQFRDFVPRNGSEEDA